MRRKDDDFAVEIEAHIRLEADRLVERGMKEEEALAAARRAFGNPTRSQERFYDSRHWCWWDALSQDLRIATRLLRKTPGWTAVAALTVALGIGATAAIFSIVNAVLLRPLPFPHPEQLYAVIETMKLGDFAVAPDYLTMRDNRDGGTLPEMAAYDSAGVNFAGADRAERLVAARVTASFFPTLQAQPLRGRIFSPEDDRPGADKVVLLSYGLWQRRFAGDPAIVGRKIRLDRSPALVIGIMPRSFDFPKGSDLWIPLALDEAQQRERKAMLIVEMIARAAPRASVVEVNRHLERLMASVKNEYPRQSGSKGYTKDFVQSLRARVRPLQEELTGDMRPALLLFSGAVGLMLLIVCFTVANLMLARATTRRREIAVRAALGSPRLRIASHLLTESLLVSLLGGALGLVLVITVIAVLNSSKETGLPQVSIDRATAAFAAVVTVLTGLAFGIAPALGSLGFGVREALESESRRASISSALRLSSRSGLRRMRQALVVAQLGLSLTLLIGAGLLAKSFYRLRGTDPGFRPENMLTARLNLTGASYDTVERQRGFIQELLRRISGLPGVEAAGIGELLPIISGNSMNFRIENEPHVPRGQEPRTMVVDASPGYFPALGARLIQGRWLSERETAEAPLAVLVNETFARKFFPGGDVLGRRISTKADEDDPGWAEIVGILGDVRARGLDRDATPTVYVNFLQEKHAAFGSTALLIRTTSDPLGLVLPLEKLVASIDRDEPLFNAKTMEQRLSDSLGSRRFDAALTGSFALIAVFLASIGVYGVMSYLVTLRTSELGIRLALGARRVQVLSMILREGAVLALIGAALGLGGALALSRYLATLLYGVGTRDPATFAVAALALVAAVLAACAIPGRRAANVEPAIALRHD
ncbi:MAG TPA: ABC transporter permease [Bryobacteraceae bacterium]